MRDKPLKAKGRRDRPAASKQGRARVTGGARAAPGRRVPRQPRARVTVDAIVEAAAKLLVERGLAGITTNAVAERAGVSIGSLYQYFPDKQALLEAVQSRHRAEVMPLVDHALARLADPEIDLVDGLLGFLRGMAALHRRDPAGLRALVEELDEQASPAEIEAFTALTTRMLASRSGRSEAEVKPTAWLATLTLAHVSRALVHHPPEVDEEALLRGLEQMMRALFEEVEGGRLRQRVV